MELLPWIDPSKLRLNLNRNPNAIDYLKTHPELIQLNILVQNASFKLLPEHLDDPNLILCILDNPGPEIKKLTPNLMVENYIYYLCKNPYCIDIIEAYPDKNKLMIRLLCCNYNAVDIVKRYMDDIDWDYLCLNESPKAMELILANPDKINWLSLSSNPSAIKILEDNPDKIDYWGLSWNYNAIHLIEQHPEKINWIGLSMNKNAMHILEKNCDKIEWYQLSVNPGIFECNYQKMSIERTNVILEELMAKSLHPSRIEYWLMNGMELDNLPE